MILRYEQIRDAISGFQTITKLRLPIKRSYQISKWATRLDKELKFYNAERQKLFDELGTKNDNCIQTIKPENQTIFTNKMKELDEMEVDIPLEAFSIEWFKDETLTAADLISLSPFLSGELDAE